MKGIDKKLIIFTTKKRFNDRNADDMQSGDMDINTLKNHYHLGQVSTFILIICNVAMEMIFSIRL